MSLREFEGSIVKINDQGHEVLSSYIDDGAGELKRHDPLRPTDTGSIGAPRNVAATANNGQITVSWSPSLDPRGVVAYRIDCSPATMPHVQVASTNGLSVKFTPTNQDQPYTFTVTAITDSGSSAPSQPSNSVAAHTGPISPSRGPITGGTTVTFTPPLAVAGQLVNNVRVLWMDPNGVLDGHGAWAASVNVDNTAYNAGTGLPKLLGFVTPAVDFASSGYRLEIYNRNGNLVSTLLNAWTYDPA